jgi:hypothetical protein
MTFKSNTRIDFSKGSTIKNNFHEGSSDHIKHFAGYIEIDGKECVVTHSCKFRSEAIAEFKQIAARNHGKFRVMYPMQQGRG